MVLAAGLGTRLRPLTEDRAKPAVPFLGVPVVRTLVLRLLDAGFERIVVNLHHRPSSVRDALSGLPVTFSEESRILGTAGGPGLALARGLLRPDRPLLLANGKIHTDLDFESTVRTHVTSNTAITMALIENRSRAAFREVLVDGGRVVGFGEGCEPTGRAPLAFTGVQVLSPRVLATLRPAESDTVRDVFPEWIARGEVAASVERTRWWELSTPERYLGLHLRARRLGMPDASPHPVLGSGARVVQSVAWSDVHVGEGAVLERCVLLSGVSIPPETRAHHVVFSSTPDRGVPRRTILDPELVERAATS